MCTLCTEFGTKPIEDDKVLRYALRAIAPVMLMDKGNLEHLRGLVDAWVGFTDDGYEAEGLE